MPVQAPPLTARALKSTSGFSVFWVPPVAVGARGGRWQAGTCGVAEATGS